MCGITLYGSPTASASELEFFERALICDTFRGYHSTGAFVGYQDNEKPGSIIAYAKEVGEGWNFINSESWKAIRNVEVKPVVVGRVSTKIHPRFAVGHNRHATMGAKTAENAHPFQHEAVTLVHNGTMDDPSLLVDFRKFEVDSDNICYSINKVGIEETIKTMDGAYTLVWHDARDNTLNILRNSERPFHLLETVGGDWLGASEKEMLLWLQCRNKYNIFNKYVPEVKRHFECQVGVQYVFDVADGKFELKEEVHHTLPTFPAYRYSYGYGNYNNGINTNRSTDLGGTNHSLAAPSTASINAKKNVNLIIKDDARLNKQIGEFVLFQAYQFDAYPSRLSHGKITGMIDGHEDYVEIHSHCVEKSLYQEYGYLFGKIRTAYNENGVVTLVVDELSETDPTIMEAELDDDAAPLDPNGNLIQAQDGHFYTREEWERNSTCNCGWCDNQIAYEDAESVTQFAGAFICHGCYDDVAASMTSDVATFIPSNIVEDTEAVKTFVCQNCTREKDISLESERIDCCTECYKAYYSDRQPVGTSSNVIETKKVLKNGLIMNYTNWTKINTCCKCKEIITWRDAELVMFNQNKTSPICLGCENKAV
jgi:hypothetical protein